MKTLAPSSSILIVLYLSTLHFNANDDDSPIALQWTGEWSAEKSEECKELRCAIEPQGEGKYQGTFVGVCNRQFSFTVKMSGRAGDDSVVKFDGTSDLGEDNGGVYTWSGKIKSGKFTGKYASTGGKKGTFEMKPDVSH